MIILNLSTMGELFLFVMLILAFGPAISDLMGKLGSKIVIDWIFGGENPTLAQRKNFKAVAIVLVIVGLLCWFVGDSANYNGYLVLLGYIFFFMAYIRYRRASNIPQSTSGKHIPGMHADTANWRKSPQKKDNLASSPEQDTELETHWP